MDRRHKPTPFNSPLETGVRSLAIVHAAFPVAFDLQRLVEMDYLVVHSGDAGGPDSLHAPLPLRAGELLVRRGLIEKGLILMMSRSLVRRLPVPEGLTYMAGESAAPFIASLVDEYSINLKERAIWAVEHFADMPTDEIRKFTHQFFARWSSQFQSVRQLGDGR
jgi:hypothetical protein